LIGYDANVENSTWIKKCFQLFLFFEEDVNSHLS